MTQHRLEWILHLRLEFLPVMTEHQQQKVQAQPGTAR
jgi:hypothetical protein